MKEKRGGGSDTRKKKGEKKVYKVEKQHFEGKVPLPTTLPDPARGWVSEEAEASGCDRHRPDPHPPRPSQDLEGHPSSRPPHAASRSQRAGRVSWKGKGGGEKETETKGREKHSEKRGVTTSDRFFFLVFFGGYWCK